MIFLIGQPLIAYRLWVYDQALDTPWLAVDALAFVAIALGMTWNEKNAL